MKGKSLRWILIVALAVCAQLAVTSQSQATTFVFGTTRGSWYDGKLGTQMFESWTPASWQGGTTGRVGRPMGQIDILGSVFDIDAVMNAGIVGLNLFTYEDFPNPAMYFPSVYVYRAVAGRQRITYQVFLQQATTTRSWHNVWTYKAPPIDLPRYDSYTKQGYGFPDSTLHMDGVDAPTPQSGTMFYRWHALVRWFRTDGSRLGYKWIGFQKEDYFPIPDYYQAESYGAWDQEGYVAFPAAKSWLIVN
jgi:hypothetical protein